LRGISNFKKKNKKQLELDVDGKYWKDGARIERSRRPTGERQSTPDCICDDYFCTDA